MADVTLGAQGNIEGAVEGTVPRSPLDSASASRDDTQGWLVSVEKSPLTLRYYLTIALMVVQEMFEFYDFFLVGYLVSVLAPSWHLTYGQSAVMLLSSGVGAIVGSLVGCRIADRVGRKKMICGGGLIFSLGAAGCAAIPDGAWILFSTLRFVVGFGMTAAISGQSPLIVEITRQERLLPSLDRFVQGFLSRYTFGGKLVIALRERRDDAFKFVHLALTK